MNRNKTKSWVSIRDARLESDGNIIFKTSGWDGDVHWTGEGILRPEDEQYVIRNWIFENRDVFPPLIEDLRIATVSSSLVHLGRLTPPADGVFVLENSGLASSLRERIPCNVYSRKDQTDDIWKALEQITGCNCFVFSRGRCEATLNIAKIETDEAINLEQAVAFICSIKEQSLPAQMAKFAI